MNIEKEELDLIVEQQVGLNTLLKEIGFLAIQKEDLLLKYRTAMAESNATKVKMEEKYGSINIDLSDGTYTEVKAD